MFAYQMWQLIWDDTFSKMLDLLIMSLYRKRYDVTWEPHSMTCKPEAEINAKNCSSII